MTAQLKPLEPYQEENQRLQRPARYRRRQSQLPALVRAWPPLPPAFRPPRQASSTPRPSTSRSPMSSAMAPASSPSRRLLGQQERELFQPGRRQHLSAGSIAAVALYPPVRARLPGSLQRRLETRSASHGAAERAVGGGRGSQAPDGQSGRRRQGAHGPVFHLGARAGADMAAELQRPDIEAKVTIPAAPGRDGRSTTRCPTLRKVVPLMARLGALGPGHRPDAGVQYRACRAGLANLHAGRFQPLPPVHPRRADRSGSGLSAVASRSTISTAWSCSPCC